VKRAVKQAFLIPDAISLVHDGWPHRVGSTGLSEIPRDEPGRPLKLHKNRTNPVLPSHIRDNLLVKAQIAILLELYDVSYPSKLESSLRSVHPIDMSVPVSVLDLVGMRTGESAGSAIARSVNLAQHAEKWGYRRFWLAEHHSISGLACSATSLLIGHVASATSHIRVGSGGVMLPNHAPLVVAEQFGTLEALYPGRIDLGLGRAPGGDFHTMRALRRDLRQSGGDFPELLQELRTYLGPERPGQVVKAIPGQGSRVPITLLGSSDFSARLAATLGLPFAFAAHFAPDLLESASYLYRTEFQTNETLEGPWLMVGVPVIAAKTDAAARRLFTTPQQRFLRLIRSQPVELLPPVDSMDAIWNESERAVVESKLGAAIVGSDSTVEAGLRRLLAATGADEIIAVTDTWDHAARLDSYERVAAVAERIAQSANVVDPTATQIVSLNE
jgi:luciferase family oxidoreductase group 1